MPQYRCYFLDHRYYVVDNRLITCKSDDDARGYADGLLAEHVYPAIEILEGSRQVHDARKSRAT
jgi:hypothetical protein